MGIKEDIAKAFPDLSERRQRQIAYYVQSLADTMKQDAIDNAMDMLLAIPVLVLHDKFGFGQERLGRFLSAVRTWITACNEDENTLAEVVKTAQEEAHYEIQMI